MTTVDVPTFETTQVTGTIDPISVQQYRRRYADALNGVNLHLVKDEDLRFVIRELQRTSLLVADRHSKVSFDTRKVVFSDACHRFMLLTTTRNAGSLRGRNAIAALLKHAKLMNQVVFVSL